MNASIAFCGQVAGRIDAIRPVAEVIHENAGEFSAVLSRVADEYLTGSDARSEG